MTLTFRLVNGVIKQIVRFLCRIDDSQLHKVPHTGPLIIVANHINFLEVPILYTHLLPRPLTGFAKSENWDNFATRLLFEFWGGIPIRRGEADLSALKRGLAELEDGRILAISPEGTRSGHGRLQACHPGIVLMALRSGAPILPLAYHGTEEYRRDWSRLRRPDFKIRIGRPFHLIANGIRVNQAVRKQMLDEIMFRVAALLPEANRGIYSDLASASRRYLHFLPEPIQ